MPLYAYRCTQCGHRFEKIQKFSSPQELVCPQCHGALERPLTAPRLNFKGAGWYVNDYAAKSSAPASEAGSGAVAAEAKTPASASEKTAASSASPASEPAAASSTAPVSGTAGSSPSKP